MSLQFIYGSRLITQYVFQRVLNQGGCEAKANEGNIIKSNKQYKSTNKDACLKPRLLLHASQGASRVKNSGLSTLRYRRDGNKLWYVGNTGEELVATGEAAFVVLCRDTGWSTQYHVLIHGKFKGH